MLVRRKQVREYVLEHCPGKRIGNSFFMALDARLMHIIDHALHVNGGHMTITSDCLTVVPASFKGGNSK